MRYSIELTCVAVLVASISLFACTRQVKGPSRKVLAYGQNYKTWSKITKRKVISNHHGNTEKDVYANDIAHKVFMRAKKLPYPKGATFIVMHFKEGEPQEYAYVMHKMDKDYDPDRGNWKYTIVRVSDWTIEQDGRIANCISCHEKGMASDFIRLDRKLFQKISPF